MNHLLLKWGTLKGWDFKGNEKAIALLTEYQKIGMSWGAATQQDTPRQKEIILELIDVCDGETKRMRRSIYLNTVKTNEDGNLITRPLPSHLPLRPCYVPVR